MSKRIPQDLSIQTGNTPFVLHPKEYYKELRIMRENLESSIEQMLSVDMEVDTQEEDGIVST